LIASLLALGITCEVAIHAANLRTRHRAEDLLDEVRLWRLGETTFSSTGKARANYNARQDFVNSVGGSVPERDYSISLANGVLNTLALEHPRFWRFGVKPSGVLVIFRFREEKLSYLSYALDIPVVGATGRPSELTAQVRLQEQSGFEEHPNYHIGVGWRPSSLFGKYGDGALDLATIVTPKARQAESNAAFDFHLSCLSSFRGCQALCEIMSSVWQEALRRNENKEISLPKELIQIPECSLR
jgi:hypothetical protein